MNIHSDTHIYNPDKYFFNFLSRRCRFEFELNLPPTLEGKPIYHIIHPFDNSQWVKYGKNISINVVFVSVWKITSKAKIDYLFLKKNLLNIRSWSGCVPFEFFSKNVYFSLLGKQGYFLVDSLNCTFFGFWSIVQLAFCFPISPNRI